MSINVSPIHKPLHTVVYRISKYLNNPDRQEKILFGGGNSSIEEFKALAKYEKDHQKSNERNNEARELMIPLPNDLLADKEKTKTIINDLVKNTIGLDTPYLYSVHQKAKGAEQDNLHVHIVYSERKRNKEATPKTYKRDIWYDFTAKKMSKKGIGQIIHHKGDIMKDNEGNIIYDSEPFTTKNKYFSTQACTYNFKKQIAKTLNSYGYDFSVYDKDSPYLKQEKIYKGYTPERKEQVKNFNNHVKEYNKNTKELLNVRPDLENKIVEKKKELFKTKERPLLEKIKHLTALIKTTLENEKEKIKETTRKLSLTFKQFIERCSQDENNNLVIETDPQEKINIDVTIANGDYEILKQEDEKIEIGVYEQADVMIQEHFDWSIKRGDDELLLDYLKKYEDEFLGVGKNYDYSL